MSGRKVAVIGAGIAGLSAAFRLQRADHDVTLFETGDRVGGRVRTIEKGGFLMDQGAAVYLGTYREAIQTIKDVGLGGELRELPSVGAIPRNGKMHELDFSKPLRAALTTGVMSPMAKLGGIKLAQMLFRNMSRLGYDDYDGLASIDNETSYSYSRRALNRELHDYLTEPLVRGTWAADDRESSNALMLWSIRNMFVPTVFGLDTGMDALPRAIAKTLNVKLLHTVTNVADRGGLVEVSYSSPDAQGEQMEQFDAVIIATTAKPALSMFPQMDDNHRALYETARYRGMVASMVALNRAPTDRLTYILVPIVEDQDYIAVISDHNKAAGHVPAGKSMYTLNSSHDYLYRTWDHSDEQMLADSIACVERYHGGDVAGTLEQYQFKRWKEVVPVVNAGRFKAISKFRKGLNPRAKVQFASDLDRIPGVNGALVSGWEAAKRIIAHGSNV